MPRTIVIGDVHGCATEFETLLSALEPESEDCIIQVGDLINRGPDSRGAIELARKYKVNCILGNHELRLLNARQDSRTNTLKSYDLETIDQLTEDDWNYLKTFSNYFHIPEQDVVVVHAGFLPAPDWHSQPIEVITEIQRIDTDGRAARRTAPLEAASWIDSWPGSPFVVYGHTPLPEVVKRPDSIGIDTGCVYGGHLTAYIVEEQTVIQVPAQKVYAAKNSIIKKSVT